MYTRRPPPARWGAGSVTPHRRVQQWRVARRYEAEGWPVAAGAWWDGTRFRCEAPSCWVTGLHAAGHGDAVPTAGSPTAPAGWRRYPYTMLLLTGFGIDALELPARAAAAVEAARALPTPPAIARVPTGRWLLFAASHRKEMAEGTLLAVARAAGAVHHGHGSNVPLPPSRLALGPVRWHRRPWTGGLPPVAELLAVVVPLLPSAADQRPDLSPETIDHAAPAGRLR